MDRNITIHPSALISEQFSVGGGYKRLAELYHHGRCSDWRELQPWG